MKLIHKIAIVVLTLVTGVAAQTPGTSSGSSTKSFTDEYDVIVQKNIFLKDRRSSNTIRRPSTYTPPPPVPVEKTYKLIGVVVGDQESRAYFEHSGRIEHLAVGAKLALGTIASIEVNGIQYEANEKQTLIRVGQDLTGAVASSGQSWTRPTVTSTPPPGTSTGPALGSSPGSGASAGEASGATTGTSGEQGPSANGGDTSTMSIEERMRRRRLEAAGN